jgi:membrane glycosyltransferase
VRAHAARLRLVVTAAQQGPAALTRPQKLALLTDPVALAELHGRVWTSPEAHRWLAPDAAPEHGAGDDPLREAS